MSDTQEQLPLEGISPIESGSEGGLQGGTGPDESKPVERKISPEDLAEFREVIGNAHVLTEQATYARTMLDSAVNAMRDAEAEVRYVGRKLAKKYGIDHDKDIVDIASGEIKLKA